MHLGIFARDLAPNTGNASRWGSWISVNLYLDLKMLSLINRSEFYLTA